MTTLTLRANLPAGRISLAGVTPAALAGKSVAEIERLPLVFGNRRVPLAELFAVAGAPGEKLILAGTDTRCDSLGEGLDGGTLVVDGDAGLYAGRAMKKGLLHIRGSAGDFFAAAHPGTRRGMAGGVARVDRNAGNRVGEFLRRGIVLVGGDAGGYCGARATAGTVVVLGRAGAMAGWSLKRASLVLAQAPVSMPPTFGDAGIHELLYLRLLARALGLAEERFARVRRFTGDGQVGGRGEILMAAP
ncbi:MAG: formylmethanofuran dehydrogenase subunit C [Alphaproteobacteria bacterium]|nr:formylmethanofuran dehydrogenase subunit C [Alphaproteobacteria bacterium]